MAEESLKVPAVIDTPDTSKLSRIGRKLRDKRFRASADAAELGRTLIRPNTTSRSVSDPMPEKETTTWDHESTKRQKRKGPSSIYELPPGESQASRVARTTRSSLSVYELPGTPKTGVSTHFVRGAIASDGRPSSYERRGQSQNNPPPLKVQKSEDVSPKISNGPSDNSRTAFSFDAPASVASSVVSAGQHSQYRSSNDSSLERPQQWGVRDAPRNVTTSSSNPTALLIDDSDDGIRAQVTSHLNRVNQRAEEQVRRNRNPVLNTIDPLTAEPPRIAAQRGPSQPTLSRKERFSVRPSVSAPSSSISSSRAVQQSGTREPNGSNISTTTAPAPRRRASPPPSHAAIQRMSPLQALDRRLNDLSLAQQIRNIPSSFSISSDDQSMGYTSSVSGETDDQDLAFEQREERLRHLPSLIFSDAMRSTSDLSTDGRRDL